MKVNKYLKSLLFGGLICSTAGMTSCDDYLTVLPTSQITEEDFWQNKNDLDGVRAAAYVQMASSAVTSRILYWGELRGDNITQNDMTQTALSNVISGILMPTNSMYDWSSFYTGINHCNLVIQKGDEMTVEGSEVDPSFRLTDWRPIKAEMIALRGLYYFYLVRAYRDVPYVTTPCRTDDEASKRTDGQTDGVNVLGKIIPDLEEAATYAADNFGNTSDNTGRFTKRGVHALLADMYLWRACLVQNALSNPSDSIQVLANDGETVVAQGSLAALRNECLDKSIEHADYILDYFQTEYLKDKEENPYSSTSVTDVDDDDYPWLTRMNVRGTQSIVDALYSAIWGTNAYTEAIFQLKYDGDDLKNDALYTYFYNSSNSGAGYVAASSILYGSAGSEYNPTRGYGKMDVRLLETLNYGRSQSSSSSTTQPAIMKNVWSSVIISNLEDMSEGITYTSVRTTHNQNWPVYRITDVMLIKAEAIARRYPTTVAGSAGDTFGPHTDAEKLVAEGFKLTNKIFERNNPAMKESSTFGTPNDGESDRLHENYAYYNSDNVLTGADLLTLVYNERQREFAAEGKRWFDLVREAEYENAPTTVLTNFITLSTSVRNRLRQLYSLYSPIYSEEIKINGVDYGGNLVQNPVWDRYTTK